MYKRNSAHIILRILFIWRTMHRFPRSLAPCSLCTPFLVTMLTQERNETRRESFTETWLLSLRLHLSLCWMWIVCSLYAFSVVKVTQLGVGHSFGCQVQVRRRSRWLEKIYAIQLFAIPSQMKSNVVFGWRLLILLCCFLKYFRTTRHIFVQCWNCPSIQ